MPVYPHGDGVWRVFVYVGRDQVTGKDRQKTKVIRGTRKEAELVEARLRLDVAAGQHTGEARTFGQVLDAYLEHKAISVEPNTLDTYRYDVGYITDHLRAMPLAKIDVEHLEALYGHLARKGHRRTGAGLGPDALKRIHARVHGALELARRRKWIVANPAIDAEVPGGPRRLPTPVPVDALPALLLAAADEHQALPLFIRLSLCIGSRRSEPHGLRWSGIDFATSRVTLRDVVVRTSGGWVVKPRTKTGDQRTIWVDPGTLAQLTDLHDKAFEMALACKATLASAAFVFSDAPDGSTYWNPRTTAGRFKRACVAVGLPAGTRIHDLRDLMATHCADQGVPIPVISARLGHTLNSTTADLYTGRVADSDRLAADVMGRLLDG